MKLSFLFFECFWRRSNFVVTIVVFPSRFLDGALDFDGAP